MASYAQGNLQFNRVRTFTGLGYSIFDTVPQGKVWKVESTGISGGTTNQGMNTGYLTINGVPYSNFSNAGVVIKETIWLKAGDYLGWTGGNWSYVVSLIEFNMVQ